MKNPQQNTPSHLNYLIDPSVLLRPRDNNKRAFLPAQHLYNRFKSLPLLILLNAVVIHLLPVLYQNAVTAYDISHFVSDWEPVWVWIEYVNRY